MTKTSAESSVEVEVDPEAAFRIFTEEIDLWWVRGPINHYDVSRLRELRLEPGVGGRLLEVFDESAGDMLETAVVTVWEPGRRLVLRETMQDTEADIRFEASRNGTLVTVSQYLLPGGDPSRVGFGFVWATAKFGAWVLRRDSAPRTPREISRLGIALYYADPAAAARWLEHAFGLGSWDVDRAPAEGEAPSWIDFHVGDALVILLPLHGDRPKSLPVTHQVWVHVDDLEAHYEQAQKSGAKIISEIARNGSRTYVAEDVEGYQWTFVQARPTMR